MTTIGSEIIKRINSLKSDKVKSNIGDLDLIILKNLLDKYFQSLIPICALESKTPEITQTLSEFQHAQDLNKLKQEFADFIGFCVSPGNYEELLKIIGTLEEIADINQPGRLTLENTYKIKFTNIEIDDLISKKNEFLDDLFMPINELLKMRLDSKQIYQSIKAYLKNPQEDNRSLTAKLMMLLSEDKSYVYFIEDIEVDEIIKMSLPPSEPEIPPLAFTPIVVENPPLTVTPILSEITKAATPPFASGLRKIIRPPLGVYFSSNRQTVMPLINQDLMQPACPKISPVSSPKYSAMQRYAARNSMGT